MDQEKQGGRHRVAGIMLLIALASLVGCLVLIEVSVSADVQAWAIGGVVVSSYVGFFALLRWLN